jgi:CheY-like chemotaxis protein
MKKLKILLVDDELDFLEIMSIRIKDWGYDFVKATGGIDALQKIEKEKPDVVILDYMMPDMSGEAVLERIRKDGNKVPVIMFTAYPNMEVMSNTKQLGISAFVPKLSTHTDTMRALKSAVNITRNKLEDK